MQADYYRGFLMQMRSDLAAHHGKHTKRLTECMTTGDMGEVNAVRRAIRTIEQELPMIDRMLEALDGRFPDHEVS
jgi:hypothetical protein